jgi:hypothetical protein
MQCALQTIPVVDRDSASSPPVSRRWFRPAVDRPSTSDIRKDRRRVWGFDEPHHSAERVESTA